MASRKKKAAHVDTERQAKLQKTLEVLKRVRESKTVELKPSRFMRTQVKSLDGSEQPFNLRYYQVQGAYHLLALQRMVLGDDTGTGKTIQAIAAFSHMLERNPQVRVVIVTLKSTVRQWAREIERFTTNIRPVIVETRPRTKDGKSPLDQRKESYAEWLRPRPEGERAVLILNYALMIRDWNAEGVVPVDEKGNPDPKKPVIPGVLDQVFLDATKDGAKLVVIYDEAQVFANDRTKTSEIGRFLSDRAERVYGLTATLHKSRLIEGYCIYKVIKPGVFTTKTAFMRDFCVTELQKVPGTARKIPIIVGYRNLEAYRNRIAPFYLGRRKQDVTDELPALIAKDVVCELSAAEDAKYQQALSGVLELGDGSIKDYEENKALVALNYCQQVVNSLSMLKFDPGAEVEGELDFATLDTKMLKVGALGAKEEALVDLLSDGGELEGEKVIVYTRFASLVPRLQKMLEVRRIKSVAITGAQNEKKRAAAQEAFQNAKSDVSVVFITTAGGVGINLQQARAMVFYELPWTWGDYVQCLDMQTEVLTKRGFLHYADVRPEDVVAAFDAQTSEVRWLPILNIVHRRLAADEKMYELKSPSLDIRVTGGHRMLFRRKTLKSGRAVWPSSWRFHPAEQLAVERAHYQVPISGIEHAQGVALTDAELRFIGWFLTDGSMHRKLSQVVITQAEHQPQIHDLRQCLRECDFDWREQRRDPAKIAGTFPNGKPQIAFWIPKGGAKGSRQRKGWGRLAPYLDKAFSALLENLTSDQLATLLEAMHLGDGMKGRGRSWVQRSYHIFSGHPELPDRLQSLCVRRGFKCNLSRRADGVTLHIKRMTAASLCGNARAGRPHLHESAVFSDECVWCLENALHTLITRRHGKVAIVGNCLGRMIRIGSPHKGVVTYHLMAERPRAKKNQTIDHHVYKLLREKKALIDQVIGEAAVGALDFAKDSRGVRALFDEVLADARAIVAAP